MTINLTFDRWQEVFHGPTLTGAMVDRLAHKAHILDISREKGGRSEEALEWLSANSNSVKLQIYPKSRFLHTLLLRRVV